MANRHARAFRSQVFQLHSVWSQSYFSEFDIELCVYFSYVSKRIICGLFPAGEGICFGDSGGALICGGEGVGVNHAVYHKKMCSLLNQEESICGTENTVNVYMFICPHLNWLGGYVPGMPEQPDSCKSVLPKSNKYMIIFIVIYCLYK